MTPQKTRVLVIDDEPQILRALRINLSVRGYEVFTAASGPASVLGICDLGERFRLVANEVDVVQPDEPLPKLPVARAVWEPRPSWLLRPNAGLPPADRTTPFSPRLSAQRS